MVRACYKGILNILYNDTITNTTTIITPVVNVNTVNTITIINTINRFNSQQHVNDKYISVLDIVVTISIDLNVTTI